MKTAFTVLALLFAFSVASAGEPPDKQPGEDVHALVTPPLVPSLEETLRLLAKSNDIVVPLPARTPFDADLGDRLAYRKAYRRGYRRAAATGTMITTSWADIPHRQAHIAGYYDGQSAALLAIDRRAP